MKKVLITIGSYFPGYKIGGPAITIKNLVDMYKNRDDLEFFIYCPNHDWADDTPYEGIVPDTWTEQDNCKIFYASKNCFNVKYFKTMINHFDIIYCTGAFTRFALEAGKYAKKHRDKKVVIAPMGSFFTSVLKTKRLKKSLFFSYVKLFRIFNSCIWSVSSEDEKNATISLFGKKANIVIAEDAISFSDARYIQRKEKTTTLRVVHLSRIHEKKGLTRCMDILKKCEKEIAFDFYGTIEDKDYFDACMEKINDIPRNIKINYKGSFLPQDSTKIFSEYDVFLFPTFSENFGHVIFESLKSSCIPLISDTTPWSIIEMEGCGFVLSLSNLDLFSKKLDEIAVFDCIQLNNYKKRCYDFAKERYEESVRNSGYEAIFK